MTTRYDLFDTDNDYRSNMQILKEAIKFLRKSNKSIGSIDSIIQSEAGTVAHF
jgi:hypothetical protein